MSKPHPTQTPAFRQEAVPNPSLVLGPYGSGPASGLRVALKLRQARASLLGWDAQIEAAQADYGYGHVGLEARAALGLDWPRALELVEGICGGCSQANALAYVQAVEAMAQLIVPPRAAYLRLVLCELERAASHLLNVAETLAALHLHDTEVPVRDLRERIVQATGEWAGARFHPGLITYGGLSRNTEENANRALTVEVRHVERALRMQVNSIVNNRAIASRLAGLGVITQEEAGLAGLRGPAARASGLAVDIRAGFPTGAYEEEAATIVVQRAGDAFSRLAVRLLESLESMRLVEQALDDLPPGPVRARGSGELRMGAGSGIGRVEGPRGEVFCWVRSDAQGLLGLHLSGGSVPMLGILPGLLRDNSPEDVPLLLLSADICLACAER